MPATRAFLGTTWNVDNLTTYTFAGRNLGTPASDRHVVVCYGSRAFGNTSSKIVAVTVGGFAASIVLDVWFALVNSRNCGIAIVPIPAGTSGDIVIQMQREVVRCGISLYALYGINPVPADTDSSTLDDPAMTIDIPADGIAISLANCFAVGDSLSWTGLTLDGTLHVESSMPFTTASGLFASPQLAKVVSCSFTDKSAIESAGIAVSWAPANTSVSRRRRQQLSYGGL